MSSKQALATRRLYRYEAAFLVPIDPELSMAELRALAARVWARRGRKGWSLPQIVAGRGTRHRGQWVSYYEMWGDRPKGQPRRIVLARHERRAHVLLHELRHALGFTTHGRGFWRGYFDMLRHYTRTPRAVLSIGEAVCDV